MAKSQTYPDPIGQYEQDYFSGAQAAVYIGELFVDEIVQIEFIVRNSKAPVYGFASQLYSFTLDGKVLVQGTFAINFKEAAYLPLALSYYNSILGEAKRKQNGLISGSPKGKTHARDISRRTIETMFNSTGSVGVVRKFNEDTDTQFLNQLMAFDDRGFEDIAEAFEDKIWGGRGAGELGNVGKVGDRYRGDHFPPFDIFVVYGDMNNKFANHTVKRLIDVELVSQGQAIMIDGRPILESYDFIARDLV